MSQIPKTPVSRDSDKFMLRFPDGMRERIAREASINSRSMNAEIIHRLENSFSVIVDEVSLLTAIEVFNGYAAKFNCTVSLSVTTSRAQLLENAIKNGSLPPDATFADLEPKPVEVQRGDDKPARKGSRTPPKPKADSELPSLPPVRRVKRTPPKA